MQLQFDPTLALKEAREHQATIRAEIWENQMAAKAQETQERREAALRRHFFRMFLVRSILFRVAPVWALRVTQ